MSKNIHENMIKYSATGTFILKKAKIKKRFISSTLTNAVSIGQYHRLWKRDNQQLKFGLSEIFCIHLE